MNSQILQTSIKFSIKTNNLNQIHKKIDKPSKIVLNKASPKISHSKDKFVNDEVKKEVDVLISNQSSDFKVLSGIPVIRKLSTGTATHKKDIALKRSLDKSADESVSKLRKFDDSEDTVIIEPETSSKLVIHPLPRNDKFTNDYLIKNEMTVSTKDTKSNSINAIFKTLEEKINNIDKICKINPQNQLNNYKSDNKNDSCIVNKEKPVSQFSSFSLKMQPKKSIVDSTKIFTDANEVEEPKSKNNITSKLKEERLKFLQESLREERTEKNKLLVKNNSIEKTKTDYRQKDSYLKSEEHHKTHKKAKFSKDKHNDNHDDDHHRRSRRKFREKSHSRTEPKSSDDKHNTIRIKKPDEISIVSKAISPNSLSEQVLEESFIVSSTSSLLRDKSKFSENIKRLLSKSQDASQEASSHGGSPQKIPSQPPSSINIVVCSLINTVTNDSVSHVSSKISEPQSMVSTISTPVVETTKVSDVSFTSLEPLHKPSNVFNKTSNISFKFTPKRMPSSNIFSDNVDENKISFRNSTKKQFSTVIQETMAGSSENFVATVTEPIVLIKPAIKIKPEKQVTTLNEKVMTSVVKETGTEQKIQSDIVSIKIEPSNCEKIPNHTNNDMSNKYDSVLISTTEKETFCLPEMDLSSSQPQTSKHEVSREINQFSDKLDCNITMDTVPNSNVTNKNDSLTDPMIKIKTDYSIDQTYVPQSKSPLVPHINTRVETKDLSKDYDRPMAILTPNAHFDKSMVIPSCICKTEHVLIDTHNNNTIESCTVDENNKSDEPTSGGVPDTSCNINTVAAAVKLSVVKDEQTPVILSTFKMPLSTKKQMKTEKKSVGEDSDYNIDNSNYNVDINIGNVLSQGTSDIIECSMLVKCEQQCQPNPIITVTVAGSTDMRHHQSGTFTSSLDEKPKSHSKQFRKPESDCLKHRSGTKELVCNIINTVNHQGQSSKDESLERINSENCKEILHHKKLEINASLYKKLPEIPSNLSKDRPNVQKSSLNCSTDQAPVSKQFKDRSRSKDRKGRLKDKNRLSKNVRNEQESSRHLKNKDEPRNYSNDQHESKMISVDQQRLIKYSQDQQESWRYSIDQRGSKKNLKYKQGSGRYSKDREESMKNSKDQQGLRRRSKDHHESRWHSKDRQEPRRHSKDQQRSGLHSKNAHGARRHTPNQHGSRRYSKEHELTGHSKDPSKFSKYSKHQSEFKEHSKDHLRLRNKSSDESKSRNDLNRISKSKQKSIERSGTNDKSTYRRHKTKHCKGRSKYSKDQSQSKRKFKDQLRSRKYSRDRSKSRKHSEQRSRSIKYSQGQNQSKNRDKDVMRSMKHSAERSRSRNMFKRRSRSIKHSKDRSQPKILSKHRSRSIKHSKDRSQPRKLSNIRPKEGATRLDLPSRSERKRTASNSSMSSKFSSSSISSSSSNSTGSDSSSSNSGTTTKSNCTARSVTAIIDSLSAKTRAIVPRDCHRLSRSVADALPENAMLPIELPQHTIEQPLNRSAGTGLNFSDIVLPNNSSTSNFADNTRDNISANCYALVSKMEPNSPVGTDDMIVMTQDRKGEFSAPGNPVKIENLLPDNPISVSTESQTAHTQTELVDLITNLITRAVGVSLDNSVSLVSSVPPPPPPSSTSYPSQPLYSSFTNFNPILYTPHSSQFVPQLYQTQQGPLYCLEPPNLGITDFHNHNHFAMPPVFQGTSIYPGDSGLWFTPSERCGNFPLYESSFSSVPVQAYPTVLYNTANSSALLDPIQLGFKPQSSPSRNSVALASTPLVSIKDDDYGHSHLDDQNFGSENSFRSVDSHQPPEPHELSDKDDLSSCGDFEFDDTSASPGVLENNGCGSDGPLDPFERWPQAPRPQYEHIIETEVHPSALNKRFEYAYLKSTVCNCVPPNPDEVRLGKSACDESCFNRRIKVECNHKCPVYELCTNRRFQDRIYAAFEPFHSASDKGWGIRATAPILPGTFIIEYVGELIDFPEFLSRVGQKALYNHHFVMAIQKDLFIDAGLRGNWSRFVNHSCDPNTVIERWVVNGKTRIGFFAKKMIGTLEEITIDYQFQQYGLLEQKCCCMAHNCTGVMGKVNEKLQEQIKSSHVRARLELIQKINSRGALRDISHVSDMITVIREDPPLDRDAFYGFLTVLLNTESEPCLRTFVECGGLKIITIYLDSVSWDDWALKLLFLRCLDHLKLKKRTILGSGCLAAEVVEHWAKNARYSLSHSLAQQPVQVSVPPPTMNEGLIDAIKENTGLEFTDQLHVPSNSSDSVVRFVLSESDLPENPAEQNIIELAVSIKRYFDDEKEKFYIPKLKLLHSESMADLSLNDSESKSKDSASRTSSVQGDYVKSKKQKIRRKCTEAIQRLSKDEFRRLFSERHEKSLAMEKTPIITNSSSTSNVIATSDTDYPDTFFAVKKLLSNVIIEEINRLKHSDKFLIMPAEFQNFDLDKIISDLNIVGHDGVISFINQSADEHKTSSGSTYSNSSSKSLDDTSRSDLNGSNFAKKRVGLPPNWNSRLSESGRYYFYNTVTKKTQWDIPVYPWDAGEEDPMAYDFGNASQFPITRLDVQMMYEEYKKIYKQQKLDDRRRHRLERSIQRKLNLTAGEKNKIEFSKEVFRAVKLIVKPYNSSACKIGRIQHKQDLKFLCEKFADTIISKEVKLVANLEDLEINANVRSKIKTYIEKYMANQGKCFKRSNKIKPKSKPIKTDESCPQSVEGPLTGTSHNTDSNNVPTVSDSVRTLNSPDFSP